MLLTLKAIMTTTTSRNKHTKLAVAASLVLLIIGAAALANQASKSTKGKVDGQALTPSVSIAVVKTEQTTTWTSFSGHLEAIGNVDVRARVSGAVLSVHFKEGSIVREGDLLVTIDPAPYEAEVDRAEAQVAAASARAHFAEGEADRARRLWSEQAIAQKELDEKSDAFHEADATLRAARAALQIAKLNLGYTQVRAPISGRVGKIDVTVGNLVSAGPNAPILTSLVSVDPIYASFDADEGTVTKALRELPKGSDVNDVGAIPVVMGTVDSVAEPYTGKLQLIDNQVSDRNGTIRVRAVFKNNNASLIPGQFVHVKLGSPGQSTVLLISERAVGTDQSKKFVLVVGSDNKTSYREVTLGDTVNGLRIVTSGLQAGQRVVVNGLQHVKPGMTVDAEIVPMGAEAGDGAGTNKSSKS